MRGNGRNGGGTAGDAEHAEEMSREWAGFLLVLLDHRGDEEARGLPDGSTYVRFGPAGRVALDSLQGGLKALEGIDPEVAALATDIDIPDNPWAATNVVLDAVPLAERQDYVADLTIEAMRTLGLLDG